MNCTIYTTLQIALTSCIISDWLGIKKKKVQHLSSLSNLNSQRVLSKSPTSDRWSTENLEPEIKII